MATGFDALKKNRNKSLDKLKDQLNKIGSNKFSNDDDGKYWKPTRDSAGNGMAVIRFLPDADADGVPFVQIWDHGFQGPSGKWYIEKSLTTINKPDPVNTLAA